MNLQEQNHIYTTVEVGELLFEWFRRHNGSVAFKDFNKNLKYRAGLFFPRKKENLLKEMFFLNNAMIFFCVNQVFDDTLQAKEVIDTYLKKTSILFDVFEDSEPQIRKKYELRMRDYYKGLYSDDPILTVSFSFLNNLFGKSVPNIMHQMFLATLIGSFIKVTIEMLEKLPMES